MRRLIVTNFSSIEHAEVEFRPITLIIGPQASGKSVLCKLAYFFGSLIQEQARHISDTENLDAFKIHVHEKFVTWFPKSTWGPGKFDISFYAGEVEMRVVRSGYAGQVKDWCNVKLSKNLIAAYNRAYEQAKRIAERPEREGTINDDLMKRYRLQDLALGYLRKLVGPDFVSSQLFVPAGRSFFTNFGKTLVAFEGSNNLDEITADFGRNYSALMERGQPRRTDDKHISNFLERSTSELLKGEVIKEKKQDYLATNDGRKMPLSSLSSGQQEMLPLLRVLPRTVRPEYRRALFVEEPEAHLFPDAQSRLVEVLVNLLRLYEGTVDFTTTTHSPYVLAKFNNLIKAAAVGAIPRKTSRVTEIIPRDYWVDVQTVAAYAIKNGALCNIMCDGLIDAEYLDEVSGEIASEFTRLLGVEFGD